MTPRHDTERFSDGRRPCQGTAIEKIVLWDFKLLTSLRKTDGLKGVNLHHNASRGHEATTYGLGDDKYLTKLGNVSHHQISQTK